MGIFFTPHQPVVPEIHSAIRMALMAEPASLGNIEHEAAQRTLGLLQATSPQFNPLRFFGAVVIAGILLLSAIWTARNGLADISKDLMNSFAAFSGIVVGLLGGEAQKSASA